MSKFSKKQEATKQELKDVEVIKSAEINDEELNDIVGGNASSLELDDCNEFSCGQYD